MSVVLRLAVVRRLRRQVRCRRHGHYWLKQLDASGGSQTFCGRCGRRSHDS